MELDGQGYKKVPDLLPPAPCYHKIIPCGVDRPTVGCPPERSIQLRNLLAILGFAILGIAATFASAASGAKLAASRPTTTQPTTATTTQPAWPAQWETSFRIAQRYRKSELQSIKAQITKQRKTRPRTAKHRAAIRKVLAQLGKRQRDLSAASVPPLPPLTETEIGYAGPLLDGWAEVIQVVNHNEMRAKFLFSKAWSIGGHYQRQSWQRPLWFKGVDTSKFADDKTVTLKGCFIITGTRAFKTVGGGSRTEFVVEPLDMTKWRAAYTAWATAQRYHPTKTPATKELKGR